MKVSLARRSRFWRRFWRRDARGGGGGGGGGRGEGPARARFRRATHLNRLARIRGIALRVETRIDRVLRALVAFEPEPHRCALAVAVRHLLDGLAGGFRGREEGRDGA
jgi:hypothetical protein